MKKIVLHIFSIKVFFKGKNICHLQRENLIQLVSQCEKGSCLFKTKQLSHSQTMNLYFSMAIIILRI